MDVKCVCLYVLELVDVLKSGIKHEPRCIAWQVTQFPLVLFKHQAKMMEIWMGKSRCTRRVVAF